MSVPEKRNIAQAARRIMLLQQASDMAGQAALADAMNISTRGLRYKLATNWGVGDADLMVAAALLDRRADALAKLGAAIRSAIA